MKLSQYLLLIGFVLATVTPAQGQHWEWFSPLNATTADNRLTLTPGIHPLTALRVTTTEADDYQVVLLGLTLPGNAVIDSLTFCYEIMNPGVEVGNVRLLSMRRPDAASLLTEFSIGSADPDPTCFVSHTFDRPIAGAITLRLSLNFTDVAGAIELGAIGVHVSPVVVGVSDNHASPPHVSLLEQNLPNPFNPSTRISFDLPQEQHVKLDVLSVDGRRIRTLIARPLQTGRHEIDWDGRDDSNRQLPSGIYLYRLVV
jgi:hypothetical protein